MATDSSVFARPPMNRWANPMGFQRIDMTTKTDRIGSTGLAHRSNGGRTTDIRQVHLGLDFDGPIFRGNRPDSQILMGPKTFLAWLETLLGCGSFPENTEYLRIELFRQSLKEVLAEKPAAFFARSFEADRFATAQNLLDWRDELLLTGWNFADVSRSSASGSADVSRSSASGSNEIRSGASEHIPVRLADLAAVENSFQKKLADPSAKANAAGFADRFEAVLKKLETEKPPTDQLILNEPAELWPPGWQRLFHYFQTKTEPLISGKTPGSLLDKLAQRIENQPVEAKLDQPEIQNPKSEIVILKAARETDAATFLAQFLKKNTGLRPVFFIPELDRTLDYALIQEGLPGMGILSASLARPSLQILKLAPAFLWEPVDVFKIMEFVTLPVKPLDDSLALLIARLLSEKPGFNNDNWLAATREFFEKSEKPEAKKQFDFWFNRRRYPLAAELPKREAVAIYSFINDWASTAYEENGSKFPSLLVLAEQARRIRELLDALPETRLSFLDLERIVRTIYQPSPAKFGSTELGHFPFVHQPGGLAATTENLIWWNFTWHDPTRLPVRWQTGEVDFLKKIGLKPDSAERQNRLNRWRQIRPVLAANERLFFVFPEKVAGAEAPPNLFLGDLEAILGDLAPFTFDIQKPADRSRFDQIFKTRRPVLLEKSGREKPRPVVKIHRPEALPPSEYETLTSLESLFFYPYQWFLKGKMKLRPASILSVTKDTTLLGNLAHRFFEELFQQNWADFDRKAIENWIDDFARRLFEREGATLLLYGREPERAAFLTKIKRAAWSLISILKESGWQVLATEQSLEGTFGGLPVRCKPDLILMRGDERAIVDLKWSGAKRRQEMIRNEEDLQLVMYSKLVEPAEIWAHTAYFILEDARLIARNQRAFARAQTAGGTDDHEAAAARIFEKMENTFAWRLAQLTVGDLEIRTKRTAPALEILYEGQLFELLEMRSDSAKWDDFAVLVRG